MVTPFRIHEVSRVSHIGDNLGNLYYAEVTLDKNDQIEFVEVYKDGDAVSDPCSWKPGSGSYWDARRH